MTNQELQKGLNFSIYVRENAIICVTLWLNRLTFYDFALNIHNYIQGYAYHISNIQVNQVASILQFLELELRRLVEG